MALKRSSFFPIVCLLALDAVAARRLVAQAPVPILTAVSPPAVQIGGTVAISLEGKNLHGVSALRFDHHGIRAVQAVPPGWLVTVDADVPPGLYDVRAVNELGVSAPRALHAATSRVVTDRDPEKGDPVKVEPEVRYFGWIEEGVAERFRLQLPRDQKVVIDCLGERVDSRVDATLEVRELATGRRVAFSRDRLASDPVVAIAAKAGVEYGIDLWDFTYRGKFPYVFSVSSAPRVLFAFPPAVVRGSTGHIAYHGWNLPGGVALAGDGSLLETVASELGAEAALAGWTGAYRKTSDWIEGTIDVRPWPAVEPLTLSTCDQPPTLESEPNDLATQASKLPVPFDFCGRFDAPGDRDWIVFAAKKSAAIAFEIRSARLGSPCDPVLLIARQSRNGEKGALQDVLLLDERKSGFPREDSLERKFVASDRDPRTVWNPPEDGEYYLQIRNRNGRSGVDALYHLSARDPRPGFALVVTHSENVSGEALSVPGGAAQSYDVLLERQGGFEGVVRVSAEGLPPELSCTPVYLAPGENFTPLVLAAAGDAPEWTGELRVVGTAEWKGNVLRTEASSAIAVYGGVETRHPLQYVHSRFTAALPVAIRGQAPFAVRLEPLEVTVHPGQKLSLSAQVRRGEGFTSSVALAYQGLGEKASADDNGNRGSKLTIAESKVDAPIEISIKNDAAYGERTFIVYASAQTDYPEKPSDPSSKKQKRRTTVVSNPVLVRIVSPLQIELTERPPVELQRGDRLRLPFRISRLAGVDGTVNVTLKLPRDLKGVEVKPLALEKGQITGELTGFLGTSTPSLLEGLALEASLELGGKRFTALAPIDKAQVFGLLELESVQEARWGALRVELGRRDRKGPTQDQDLQIKIAAEGGGTTLGETTWRQGQVRLGVLVDATTLFVNQNRRSPLRVEVTVKLEGGVIKEELVFKPELARVK